MKHILFLALFGFGLVQAHAQISFSVDTASPLYFERTEFEAILYVDIHNNSTDPADSVFAWKRIQQRSINMQSAICFEVCYPEEVSEETFNLLPGDSTEISIHFYPYDSFGCAHLKLKINSLLQGSTAKDSMYVEAYTNGLFSCEFVGVPADLELKGVNAYPNPVLDELRLEFTNEAFLNVEVMNIQGAICFSGKCENGQVIDTKDLTPGVYFVKVSDAQARQKIFKVQKL